MTPFWVPILTLYLTVAVQGSSPCSDGATVLFVFQMDQASLINEVTPLQKVNMVKRFNGMGWTGLQLFYRIERPTCQHFVD